MNNKFDSSAEREFSYYYQSNSIGETRLLAEIEDSVTSAKTTVESEKSNPNVMFGLGIISILLLISGLQLQRSVYRIPAMTKTIQTNRELDASSNIHREISERQNYSSLNYSDRYMENAIKNSISQGKF